MLAFDNTVSEAHSADEITLGKANLVLKAAGLNASLITIEQLKFTAPVIFVKIYEAFFDDKLPGINYSPSCRDEHCHNAELVARALENRYKYQFLERVTGASILQGDKFSIESIIDLFYGVTQKNISHKATLYDSLDDGEELRRSAAMKDAASSQTVKQYYHSQKRYPNVIPGELKILMDRVTFLENKLHAEFDADGDQDRHVKSSKKKSSKKKKNRRVKSQSEDIMQVDREDEAPFVQGEDDVYVISPGHSPNSSRGGNNRQDDSAELKPRPSSGKRGEYESIKKQRRPMSAPLGGRPGSASGTKKSPGRKIKYKTSSEMRDKEIAAKFCPEAPTLDELDRIYKAKKAEKEEEERKKRQREEEFDKMYTYDTMTGRKLLITEMEQLAETRHRAEEKRKRDEANDLLKSGGKKEKENSDEAPGPTRAEWPGHRTATSAHAYVEKMTKIRQPVKEDKYPALSSAQHFAAYKYMKNLDIVISVEHCCNCSFHAMSLRHKPAEYIAHANSVMKDLAQVAHQVHPCARVGVVRFNANITKKSKESDVNSRIGALEVQVAYKNSKGNVTPELIYSKLKTRRWPSKSVIEKRLKSYMSSMDIQTYEADADDCYDRQETNGSHTYPVGTGSWEDTPLCSAAWQYTSPGTANTKFPVQWVFDSRDRASFPRFSNGAAVFVDNVENDLGYTECHHRPGVIRRSFKSNQYIDMVSVKIKYIDEEIVLPEANCVLRSEYPHERIRFEMTNGLPKPLYTILKFAATQGKVDWQLIDNRWDKCVNKVDRRGNKVPEVHLCRSSFFQQIHALAWQAVELFGAENFQMADPFSEEVVDVQLGYSEQILDDVFTGPDGKTVNTVNMSELLRNARIDTLDPEEEEEELVPESKEEEVEVEVVQNHSVHFEDDEAVTTPDNDIKNDDDSAEIIRQESEKSENYEQQQIVKEAITETIIVDQEDPVIKKREENKSTTLSFRERLQQVCLKIAPPVEGSIEAGPAGNELITSKYRAGAIVIFQSLDFDDNEELDIREFKEALVKFHLDCEDHEINKLRAGFDTDGDARITLHEFLQFLHFDNVSHRDLGDIWTTLRGTAEIDAVSTPESVLIALEEMEKDLFSMCTFDIAIGSVVSASSFVDILDKFHLRKEFEEGDLQMLLKVFALNAHTKQPIEKLKDLPIIPTSEDLQHYIVKYDDFCSWLQPVDIMKVIKRISRFVNALIDQNTAMAEEHNEFSSLDDLIATLDPKSTGLIQQDDFQTTIDNLGLPVSRAEVRVLFRHFGNSDGESMKHENFVKMISSNHNTTVSPVRGSRQFRKESVMINSPNLRHMLSAAPSSATLSEAEDVFENKQVDFVEDVFPVKYEPMMVSFSVLEASGSVLEQDYLKKFRIEIKFLLQTLEVNVGREHKQSSGKRHIDVDWDPLELSTAALNNNADISVQLSVSRAVDSNRKHNIITVLGTTYFSPRKLMEFDKTSFFDLPLKMVIEDGSEVDINIFGRLKECHKKKISNFKHAESANYNVSFDDYKFDDHEMDDDDDDHHYSDHDHDVDQDADFLANFSSPKTSPRDIIVDPLEESKAGKEVEFDDSKKYILNFKTMTIKDIENVEMFGKNDNYCEVDLGSVWSMKSSVKQDSGTGASWDFKDNEHTFVVDGKVLHNEPLKIKVYDENKLRNDVLVAEGTVSVTHATYFHDALVVLICHFKSKSDPKKSAGDARLYFEFEEFYVSDDPSHDDRNILLDLVKSTSESSPWKDNMMWSIKTELKNWLGVDATHDTVTGLHLGANGLNGIFSESFCSLKNLTELELFNNELSGDIPEDLGNLSNLRVLLLNDNMLTGEIPQSISNCTKLEEVDLQSNQLSGPIPPEIAIPTLTTLSLGDNPFSAPLPLELTSLKKLRSFSCDLCPYNETDFYKVFPFIKAHADLPNYIVAADNEDYWEARKSEEEKLLAVTEHFDDSACFSSWEPHKQRWEGVIFDTNGFVRSLILCHQSLYASQLPENIDILQNVVFLDFSDNEIGGFFPSELCKLSKLEHLFLNNNSLEGPLSTDISQLESLKTLNLSGNQLTGFLPSELSSLEVLNTLSLSSNKFEGSIPEEVLMLEKLKELDFSSNTLTGPIPDLSDLIALERLVLSGNQFTGSLPDTVCQATRLEHLDVSFNPLTGTLPSQMSTLTNLHELDIQMTKIEVEGLDYTMRKKLLLKRVASLKKLSL